MTDRSDHPDQQEQPPPPADPTSAARELPPDRQREIANDVVKATPRVGDHELGSGSGYNLDVPEGGKVTLETHIEAAPPSSIDEGLGSEPTEPDRGSRRRGCGLFAALLAVVVASPLIQRRR
jgi:hypothetical protein